MLERLLVDALYVQARRLDQSYERRRTQAGAPQRAGKEPACSLMPNLRHEQKMDVQLNRARSGSPARQRRPDA